MILNSKSKFEILPRLFLLIVSNRYNTVAHSMRLLRVSSSIYTYQVSAFLIPQVGLLTGFREESVSILPSVLRNGIEFRPGRGAARTPTPNRNFCCKNVPQSLKGQLQVGLMPFIEGVGDEVVCVAVFAASVVLIFRSSLGYHSVNLGRLGVNVIRRCFQKTWNCISAFCSSDNMESSRATSSVQEGFLTGMDSPPENDCCSVCHDNFDLPCQANCAHWFCGECILRVWHHSSALQPCKCPICRRPINLLIPCESATQRRDEPAVDSVLQNIEKYNRIFGGGSVGFFQRLRDTPLLLRRLLRELMDPQRAVPLVFRARIVCFLGLLAIYVFSPVDILPEGILGIVGLLDDVLVILVVFFHVATLYRSALFSRHGGRS